jgi:hypothetical protein
MGKHGKNFFSCDVYCSQCIGSMAQNPDYTSTQMRNNLSFLTLSILQRGKSSKKIKALKYEMIRKESSDKNSYSSIPGRSWIQIQGC